MESPSETLCHRWLACRLKASQIATEMPIRTVRLRERLLAFPG